MQSQPKPKSTNSIISYIRNKYDEHQQKERKEQNELVELKASLLDKCHIPLEFLDPITRAPLDNPLLLPCGDCFNKSTLESTDKLRCPQHGEQDKKQAISSPTLDNVVKIPKPQLEEIRREISAIKSKDKAGNISQKVAGYASLLQTKVSQFTEYKKLLLSRETLKLEILQAYDDIPDEFLDPINMMPFEDPILTPHGYIYSSQTVNKIINSSDPRCPFSRNPIKFEDITDRKGEEAKLHDGARKLISSFYADREQFQLIPLDEKSVPKEIKAYKERTKEKISQLGDMKECMRFTVSRTRLSYLLNSDIETFLDHKPAALYLQIAPTRIVEDKDITQRFHSLQLKVNTLNTRIIESKLSDEKALEKEIKNLKSDITDLFKEQKETEKIQKIIYNLKIDQTSEENLQAWSEENDPCNCWRGGVKVDYPVPNREEVRTYRVPTRIKVLMQIASSAKSYKTAAEFIQAIKNAKSMPSSWNNPFSWYTRKAQTTLLYNAETNVETFRFTRAPRRS